MACYVEQKKVPSKQSGSSSSSGGGAGTGTTVMTAISMGFTFGMALQRGQVFNPNVIQNQFVFADNTMLKMFLTASAASAFSINILRLLLDKRNAEPVEEYTSQFHRGALAVGLGSTLLGFGMQISGSCPGTVFVQAGANSPGFVAVLAGGLTGALAFSFAYPLLERSGFFEVGKPFLNRLPQIHRYKYAGLVYALCMAIFLYVLEWLTPHVKSDYGWHPTAAGIFVGLLQFPGILILGEMIGTAQTYSTVAYNMLAKIAPSALNSYSRRFLSGMRNYQQLIYTSSAIFGSFFTWMVAHDWDWSLFLTPPATGISASASFFGGMLLVFGARMAAGCTSGHGISGMGTMSPISMLAVAGMFGGAIALGTLRALL